MMSGGAGLLPVVFLTLYLGMAIYHYVEGLAWSDAFLNSAMLLGGMGPLNPIHTTLGKWLAPKGVALTHDCWCYEGLAMAQIGTLVPEDKQYLWLPLSHSFGKVLEVAILQVGLPTAIDGRIDKIVDNLGVIRPTFMAAAPRIFEKVYNRVVGQATEAGGLKAKIFAWAVGVGSSGPTWSMGR